MPGDSIEAEYPLTLSIGRNLAMVGCALAVTAGGAIVAANNTKGLRLVEVVTLSPEGASIFYWVMTAACGLFALPMALALSWRAAFIKQRVAFTQSSVWLPRTNWSTELVEVPFEEVVAARTWTYGKERVITLVLTGRKFRIVQSWLPSREAFDDILARLEAGPKARKP